MIDITLPDGSIKNFNNKITPLEIANSISEGLARNVISALVNNQQVEINTEINTNAKVQLLTWKDKLGKTSFWHSSAHLMAQAILFYYPDAKLTIGPAIENGFYYDIDFGNEKIVEADFEKIELKMLENAKKKSAFNLYSINKNEALTYFKNNPFKTELIENLEDGTITFCKHDDFIDLCKGGHLPNTSLIKAVKIMSVAGAYWRGNEKNPQLTRVYGVSFPKQKDLTEYLFNLEEAKKRDHRKLGKEMGIFTFSEKVGQGLPLWLPNGTALKRKLENFLINIQEEAGYQMVSTPHIGNKELYVTSGHYEKYGEDSFQPIHTPSEGEEFLLKPMNCPHHCEIYNHAPVSYKELPLRIAEFGTVYRYEQSGELSGLTRVRGFTQDDAHIFCTNDQLLDEFKNVIDLVLYVFKTLGFNDFTAQISLRDKENKEKYIGTDENWGKAENAIIKASQEKNLTTVVEYGEAAFYGPKLDFMVKDVLGRKWQLGTIQVDYNLPERFNLSYTGADNQKHRPLMIHRAPFGSLERFIAILLEHTAGNLPIWLTPKQIIILPISENHKNYAKDVLKLLKKSDICGFVDSRNEKTGKKIRDAEISKIPYILVVGDEELKNNTISVRKHGGESLGTISVDTFASIIKEEINNILKN
ncbi:MAG: threonine--tRNA ligase [Solirubrobacteraceae bacterium]